MLMKKKMKELYCNICETTTPHQFRGIQRGASDRTLELYDCINCRDTCSQREVSYFDIPDNSDLGRQFKQNHSHLWDWYHTGLGEAWLNRQMQK